MIINTEILTDYLNEQCNEYTKQTIKNWLDNDPKNKAYLEELRFYWDTNSLATKNLEFDSEKALLKLKKKKTALKQFHIRKLMRYAALVIILLATSITSILIIDRNSNQILVENSDDIDKILNLEDGTTILLTQDGSISYPKQFAANERLIQLTGEAFFKVAKDKSRPFIITTSHTKTTVLGTSFRISEDIRKTLIKVESGIVEFMQVDDPTNKVRLEKGEMAKFVEKQNVVLKGKQGLHNDQFKINHLTYQNEKLESICNDLNELFNINIKLEGDQIPQLLMTATFADQNSYNILESIAFSLDLEIEKKKDYILLK